MRTRAYIKYFESGRGKTLSEIVKSFSLDTSPFRDLIEDILSQKWDYFIKYNHFTPQFSGDSIQDIAFDWLASLTPFEIRSVSELINEIYENTFQNGNQNTNLNDSIRRNIKALTALKKVGLSKDFLEKMLEKDIEIIEKLELALILSRLEIEDKELNISKWKKRINLRDKINVDLAPVLISIYKKTDPIKSLMVFDQLERIKYVPPKTIRRYYYTSLKHACFYLLNPIQELKADEKEKNYKDFSNWYSKLESKWVADLIEDIFDYEQFHEINLILQRDYNLFIGSNHKPVETLIDDSSQNILAELKNSTESANTFLKKVSVKDGKWKSLVDEIFGYLSEGENFTNLISKKAGEVMEILYTKFGIEFYEFLLNKYNLHYNQYEGIITDVNGNVIKFLRPINIIKEEVFSLDNTEYPDFTLQKNIDEFLYAFQN